MANEYYVSTGSPASRAKGESAPMRAQFSNIELGFNKLPTMTGYTNKMVKVNSAGTGLSSDTLLTDNGTDLTAAGELKSTKAGQFISRTGTSTAAHWLLIGNTSGKALVGVEGSAGAEIVANAVAYDMVIKAASGLTISCDDGVSRNIRINNKGAMGMNRSPSAWGTDWLAHEWPNGSGIVGHPSTQTVYLLSNLYHSGTDWTYTATTSALLLKMDGGNRNFELYSAPSGTAGNTATLTKLFGIDSNADITSVRDISIRSITMSAGATLNVDSGTATATAGAATLNKMAGVITSEALTTAAGAEYALTLTNSVAAGDDIVLATVANGTNSTEGATVTRVAPGTGSLVIRVKNTHASSALNGTIKINFLIVKA